MERIKEALQRARLERGGERPGIEGATRLLPTGHSRKPSTARIEYSQTRSVQLPAAAFARNRIVAGIDDPGVADAFNILATQVSQRMGDNGWKTLAITSASGREGKTLVAINLAICIAAGLQQTALLVDCDLRHPNVARMCGVRVDAGLRDYLVNGVPIDQMLVSPGILGFVVLPGGDPIANSTEMLRSHAMAHLVREMRDRYPGRMVMFDLPPVLGSADVLAFLPRVDATLLVVEEGETQKPDLLRAAELLADANLIGTVLNKSEEATAETSRFRRRHRRRAYG